MASFSAVIGFAHDMRAVFKMIFKFCLVVVGVCFEPFSFVFFSGVVPESQSQVEEEGTFWPDATGPNTLLYSLRAASTDSARELCTGKDIEKSES